LRGPAVTHSSREAACRTSTKCRPKSALLMRSHMPAMAASPSMVGGNYGMGREQTATLHSASPLPRSPGRDRGAVLSRAALKTTATIGFVGHLSVERKMPRMRIN
jgi:hypothetical protein